MFKGGQILRNSVTLSCLMKIPITVENVRGKRSKPGLRPQHLAGKVPESIFMSTFLFVKRITSADKIFNGH